MGDEANNRTLGDYFTLQRGTTYKGSLLGNPGPVLLGLATIQRNGGFRSDSLKTYGGDSPEKLLVRAGELYLSLKDVTQSADLLGAVAKLPAEHAPGRLTQDTVKLEPKFNDAPLDYLYWLLRTPQYRAYCRSHATGTTNLGLAREDFLAFPAPAPTAAQEKIAATLSALNDKIELNRRRNQTLEAMARALFKDWFVDFGPVRAKMEGRDPYLPPDLWQLFPDCLDDEGKPEGWRCTSLADFASLNPESWTKKNSPNEICYVDLSNTNQGTIESASRIPWAEAPSRARRILRPGDTIIGTVRPGNRSFALIGEEGMTGSTGFAVLKPLEKDFRDFVFLSATSPENFERLTHLADGAAYPAVRPDVVLASPVTVPPREVVNDILRGFANTASGWVDTIERNKQECRTLAQLRDTLLPKTISGELRISDVEKFIGRIGI